MAFQRQSIDSQDICFTPHENIVKSLQRKTFFIPRFALKFLDRVVLGDLQMFDWEIIEFRYFYLR